MIVAILLLTVILGLGIVILAGRGDKLIAGYNTAEEERKRFNLKRLRIVTFVTITMSGVAVTYPFLVGRESDVSVLLSSSFAVIPIVILGLTLANTWCVRK